MLIDGGFSNALESVESEFEMHKISWGIYSWRVLAQEQVHNSLLVALDHLLAEKQRRSELMMTQQIHDD
jgi:hypothetical protein